VIATVEYLKRRGTTARGVVIERTDTTAYTWDPFSTADTDYRPVSRYVDNGNRHERRKKAALLRRKS
jgi:hypothetical protein